MTLTSGVARHLPAPTRAALDRALARADVYRVLAAVFRDPDDPAGDPASDLATLRAAARALRVAVEPRAARAIGRMAGRDARTAEHRAIFGHVVAHGCPPYETEYGQSHLFGQSQELGDIRGFYEAFGVRPRRGGERPDHLACELEFLSLLAIKEATALAVGDAERVAICVAATARFVEDHPGRWVGALATQIASRAPGSGYAAAAARAATILAGHAREVGVAPRVLDPDDLVPIEDVPDGFAFECGLDVEAGDLVPPGAAP
jgi:TorA maturation chaperone TorD